MKDVKKYKSAGKLLLTGEYVVMDGALSLAFPAKQGQTLEVEKIEDRKSLIDWKAYDYTKNIWFECIINYYKEEVVCQNNENSAEILINIFKELKNLNKDLFIDNASYNCNTFLDFPRDWGLGTSSTLINNFSLWSQVDPYFLLDKTFGGSGYDIACANASSFITYQQINENKKIQKVEISSEILKDLYFVHLNQKQNSREGIKLYKNKDKDLKLIDTISSITRKIIDSQKIEEFSKLLQEHENLISSFLGIPTIKSQLFPDYKGFIKSLGAWGGDFIMVQRTENMEKYFLNKGFSTIYPYSFFKI